MPTQQPQTDLLQITDLPKNVNVPFGIGISALGLLLFSALSEYLFSLFSAGFLCFCLAFVLSIIAIVTVKKYKKTSYNYNVAEQNKLRIAKWMGIGTLVITSLIILGVISLLILIGNQGFGR